MISQVPFNKATGLTALVKFEVIDWVVASAFHRPVFSTLPLLIASTVKSDLN